MEVHFGGAVHELPAGCVIGAVGDASSGAGELLKAAGGRFIGPGHAWNPAGAPLLVVGYALDVRDAFARYGAEADLERLRRAGSTVLLASHDPDLLRRACDEVWFVKDGAIVAKGDPATILAEYTRHVVERLRTAAAGPNPVLPEAQRRGDGRAMLETLETLDAEGNPVTAWKSGEPAIVRLRIRYAAQVADPVAGIMIRTRIGMEVYGTNTELEGVKLGPCRPGDVRIIEFRFACNLCPQQYTLTAASHDPDGVWHDWMEDALAFTVIDTRHTAGVANLRASVTSTEG